MATLEDHINRILDEAGECLTAVEITLRLDAEMSGSPKRYTISEIVLCAEQIPNLRRSGNRYCRKPKDASQG